MKYDAYINVEICNSTHVVSYLYKYVFKSSNYVDMSIEITSTINQSLHRVNNEFAYRNNNDQFIDEIKIYHDARWIDFYEIAWRIFELKTKKIKSSIDRLQVHKKNQQRVLINFESGLIVESFQNNEKFRRTTLIEYFKMNRRAQNAKKRDEPSLFEHDDITKDLKEYYYHDIFIYFVWNKQKKI